MEILYKITLVFTAIGAINWGLIGLFNFNLLTALFMNGAVIIRALEVIIGICGIIDLGILFNHISMTK